MTLKTTDFNPTKFSNSVFNSSNGEILSLVAPNASSNFEDVAKIKQALFLAGYYKPNERVGETSENLTSYPDANFFDAIKKFQKDNDIYPNGIIKPKDLTDNLLLQITKNYKKKQINETSQKKLTIDEKILELGDFLKKQADEYGKEQAVKDLQRGLNILNGYKENIFIKDKKIIDEDGDFGSKSKACLSYALNNYPIKEIKNYFEIGAFNNAMENYKYNQKASLKKEMYSIEKNLNAQEEATEEKPLDNIEKWVFALENTSTTCDSCKALEGKEYKNYNDIPKAEIPPIHPNCRCHWHPVKDNGECEKCKELYNNIMREFDAIGEQAENLKTKAYNIKIEFEDLSNKNNGIFKDMCFTILEEIAKWDNTFGDFSRNYLDMRNNNVINQDKYFHAKANCQGTQRGKIGEATSKLISDLRELSDFLIEITAKGYSIKDSLQNIKEDQEANKLGRKRGRENPNADCRDILDDVRPTSLPSKY